MSDAEEVAKAVRAVATLGEKSLEISAKVAGFLAQVLQGPTEEVTGMITDKLRFVRWRRLLTIADEVNRILSERGVSTTCAVPPKLALPILEDASLEDDPVLQSLWSNLLANAMDPTFNGDIRYGFIDMIKIMTVREIAILNYTYRWLETNTRFHDLASVLRHNWTKEELTQHMAITEDDYLLSIYNLMRMQCVAPAPVSTGMSLRTHTEMERVAVYKGPDVIMLTPLGVRFVQACVAEAGPDRIETSSNA